MSRIVTGLLVIAVSCGLSFSQSRTKLEVRVLDNRTGHPVNGWKVGLLAGNSWMVTRTAKTGEAAFSIPDPVPPTLGIDPEAGGWSEWSCTLKSSFQTAEVWQTGVVGKLLAHPLCRNHIALTAAAHAGEIVIYVRRLNPWLTLRRVLWEIFYG